MRISTPNTRTYLSGTHYKEIEPRQYILAFEGMKTEPQYFDGIRKYADTIGINAAAIRCIPLVRSTPEEGFSHPEHGCLPLLEKCISEYQNGEMSIETLAVHIIDWAADICIIKRKENQKYLAAVKNQIIERFSQDGHTKEETIPYSEIEPIAKKGYEHLKHILQCELAEKQYTQYIDAIRKEMLHISKNDIACLIIDRDPKSFSKEAYTNVQNRCRDKKIQLIVSNPQFEFWLLLHFTDAAEYDKEQLQKNQGYLLSKLREKIGHDPKRVIFTQYLNNVKTAILNEHNYAETLDELQDHLGSNVGTLLSDLLGTAAEEQTTEENC